MNDTLTVSRWRSMTLMAAVLAVSCVSTGYHSMSHTGGFSETPLSETSYQVRFQGNSFTSSEAADAMLLRRAAELTLERGYRYFVLSDQHSTARGDEPSVVATIRFASTADSPTIDAATVLSNVSRASELSPKARAALVEIQRRQQR
ncbi:MAG TPA: hypothetical protein VN181_03465 [Thermoanaerobaculia bacterium]|nr:hypothetical protein [Thermoanaerobaculia bacterium]